MIFALIYSIIIFIFIFGLTKKTSFKTHPQYKISIISAARNEERNIKNLLDSIQKQTYPKNLYELIIVSDRSTDKTIKILRNYDHKNMNLQYFESPQDNNPNLIGKKKALSIGIDHAENQILAFIDADCIPSPYWLEEINKHYDDETDYLLGYSELLYKNKFATYLKNIERSGFMACVAGASSLNIAINASGANLSYRKSMFNKVNGFKDIGKYQSGDDFLMLFKMAKYIRKIKYMYGNKSSVISYETKNINQQINNETRRASGWKRYPIWLKALTLYVFIFYLYLSYLLITNFIDGKYSELLTLLALKVVPEFLLILIFLIKTGRIKYIITFPIAEILYIPYYVIFGIKGLVGKFKWKE